MTTLAIDLIKRHEGFRSVVYRCTAGKKTIGYGYNLQANPLCLKKEKIDGYYQNGITEPSALLLLTDHVSQLEFMLCKKILVWPKLNAVRQAVLLDMAFNLGVNGLLSFKNMLSCLNRADYVGATDHMLSSDWAGQVKKRAWELAGLMLAGKSV